MSFVEMTPLTKLSEASIVNILCLAFQFVHSSLVDMFTALKTILLSRFSKQYIFKNPKHTLEQSEHQ